MGFYDDRFIPWIIEHAMARPPIAELRPQVLAGASGDILEIGFGTGRNLAFYPPEVKKLTVLEPNRGMARYAAPRLAASPIDVTAVPMSAEELPFDAGRFDTVVSTWTMCTIPDLDNALAEFHRVLKPGGKLLFIEHGRSPDPKIARWQRWMNPCSRFFGGGCHMDRDIPGFIRRCPLRLESLEQFYMKDTPKVGGYTSKGAAVK